MRSSKLVPARFLIGSRVYSGSGESLGKIDELVVDSDTGGVPYAVVALDEASAAGRLFVVPWSELDISTARDYAVLNVRKDFVERAPTFDRDHWPDLRDPAWQGRVADYYGVVPPAPDNDGRVTINREAAARHRSVFASTLMLLMLTLMLAFTYLIWTRGPQRAWTDVSNSTQSVVYAMKETSEDVALTAKVKSALALSSQVDARNVKVQSLGGVVTLRGEVGTQEERALAEWIARNTVGVTAVRSELAVNPPKARSNELDQMRNRVADLEVQYHVSKTLMRN